MTQNDRIHFLLGNGFTIDIGYNVKWKDIVKNMKQEIKEKLNKPNNINDKIIFQSTDEILNSIQTENLEASLLTLEYEDEILELFERKNAFIGVNKKEKKQVNIKKDQINEIMIFLRELFFKKLDELITTGDKISSEKHKEWLKLLVKYGYHIFTLNYDLIIPRMVIDSAKQKPKKVPCKIFPQKIYNILTENRNSLNNKSIMDILVKENSISGDKDNKHIEISIRKHNTYVRKLNDGFTQKFNKNNDSELWKKNGIEVKYIKPSNNAHNVHYLHGALHLLSYKKQTASLRPKPSKNKSNTLTKDRHLTPKQCEKAIKEYENKCKNNGKKVPGRILVLEGTKSSKENEIYRRPYLNAQLKKLESIENKISIFGCNIINLESKKFNNDTHIWDIIFQNKKLIKIIVIKATDSKNFESSKKDYQKEIENRYHDENSKNIHYLYYNPEDNNISEIIKKALNK